MYLVLFWTLTLCNCKLHLCVTLHMRLTHKLCVAGPREARSRVTCTHVAHTRGSPHTPYVSKLGREGTTQNKRCRDSIASLSSPLIRYCFCFSPSAFRQSPPPFVSVRPLELSTRLMHGTLYDTLAYASGHQPAIACFQVPISS